MTSIKLMKHEYEWPIIDISPTTAISFYTVNETDVDKTISYLTKRFQRIVKVNPWLSGRLKRERNDGESVVYLTYDGDSVGDSIKDMLTITEDSKLFELTDWMSITDYLCNFKPKKGSECIDKDEMLCRLIVFKSATTKTNTMGVMLCLNHCIGDGWTFYRLWHMLDKDEVVEQMSVDRHQEVVQEVERCTNLEHICDSSAGSLKLLFGKVGRGIKRRISGKSPPRKFMYKVNGEAVAAQKSEFNQGDDCFVSTNDILCSWFFELCDPSHGMVMVVNVRNRVPEVHDNMAGNYVFGCPVNFADIKTPAEFRHRWKNIITKKLPADVVDRNSASNLSSSWLDAYQHVELNKCIHLNHIPVFSDSDFGGSVWGIPLASECALIPFRFNTRESGVIISAYNDRMTEEYFDSCELLDGQVGNLLSNELEASLSDFRVERASSPKQIHCDL